MSYLCKTSFRVCVIDIAYFIKKMKLNNRLGSEKGNGDGFGIKNFGKRGLVNSNWDCSSLLSESIFKYLCELNSFSFRFILEKYLSQNMYDFTLELSSF